MTDEIKANESKIQWWARHIIVPLIGSGGVIAIIVAIILRPPTDKNPIIKTIFIETLPVEKSLGGGRGELRNPYTIKEFDSPKYIEKIQVWAHDCIGNVQKAQLALIIDAQELARKSIGSARESDNGSCLEPGPWQLEYKVRRTGTKIRFASYHVPDKPGDDETFLKSVSIHWMNESNKANSADAKNRAAD